MKPSATLTIHRSVLLVLVIYWGFLFVGTHVPVPVDDGIEIGDKMLHFLAYAGLGFLLSWTTMRLRATVLGSLGVLLVIMTYGMVDEWTQNLVPTRSMEVGDWFADAVGGLAGLISYFVTQWLYLYLLMPARPVADPH